MYNVFLLSKANSRKYRRVFKVKSQVKPGKFGKSGPNNLSIGKSQKRGMEPLIHIKIKTIKKLSKLYGKSR